MTLALPYLIMEAAPYAHVCGYSLRYCCQRVMQFCLGVEGSPQLGSASKAPALLGIGLYTT